MTDCAEVAHITRRSALRDTRGYFGVGLMRPKADANVGAALRACGVYGAAMMAIQGRRFQKCSTDTMKAWRHLPVIEVDAMRLALPYGCVPVAIELVPDARSLVGYTHPERAFYIFGPEERLSRARGHVLVPRRALHPDQRLHEPRRVRERRPVRPAGEAR